MKTQKLTIFHDDNSSFVDLSDELLSYHRDTGAFVMETANDYLYIGLYKPINSVYVEMGTVNTNAATFTVEYYNGTTWADVTGLIDDTNGMTRSGFIKWNRNLTDETATTINSVEKYYIRISTSATFSAGTTLKGLNIVFSDDQDLKEEWFEASTYVPSGENSHILKHVSARNQIVQEIRNDGRFKVSDSTGEYLDIDAFDLLQFEQIREASKYLVLSKICFDLTNEPDDTWWRKYEEFKKMYKDAVNVFYLNLDSDDDGIEDTTEQMRSFASLKVYRR